MERVLNSEEICSILVVHLLSVLLAAASGKNYVIKMQMAACASTSPLSQQNFAQDITTLAILAL